MNKTGTLTVIFFMINVLLLSACGQAAVSTAQIPAPQLGLPSQASNIPTSAAILTQSIPPQQATGTPSPIAILPQPATSVPTQQSGGSGNAYVAYASGLASSFTKGDICSLEQPFVLEGDAIPVSTGLMANFTPSSSTHGGYTFTNNIVSGGCVDTSSGTYDITFYTADEGDIIMTGEATRVCQGVTVFSGTTDFQIAIKKAQLTTCP